MINSPVNGRRTCNAHVLPTVDDDVNDTRTWINALQRRLAHQR